MLIYSDHLLDELTNTLDKPWFASRISPEQAARSLRAIRIFGEHTPISVLVSGIATHPEDDQVLAALETAQADFLVTGDKHLQSLRQHAGIEIVSPGRFVEILDASLKPLSVE